MFRHFVVAVSPDWLVSGPTQRPARGSQAEDALEFFSGTPYLRASEHPEVDKGNCFTLCRSTVRLLQFSSLLHTRGAKGISAKERVQPPDRAATRGSYCCFSRQGWHSPNASNKKGRSPQSLRTRGRVTPFNSDLLLTGERRSRRLITSRQGAKPQRLQK